jgi:hypothetical protein
METKALTLRLDADKAAELEQIARVDNMSVSDAVRTAIDDRIAQRREDKDFQDRLKRIITENQAVLKRLAQ